MAVIIPSRPPDKTPNSERKVRDALAPVNGLTVLHSVAWQARRNGRPADGEADFVVLVPTRGILVLEVKGGGVDLRDGRWYSTGADGIENPIKNPFEQATSSKHALVTYFQAVAPAVHRIKIVHAVVFPDINVVEGLGFNAPRSLIIDREDLKHPAESIAKVFDHWEVSSPFTQLDADRIVAALAPTTKVRRLLKDDVADARDALLELTSQQISILQFLRRVKRAAILGGAGTGKTVLGVEKARQMQAAGFRTLMLCYNAPLRAHLAETLSGSGVDVHTFHSLVLREMKAAKLKAPADPDDTWYEAEAPDRLAEAATKNGTVYDAVIVDEAQDFSLAWLVAVERTLLGPDGHLYVFADSHQDLYQRGWVLPEGMTEYELTVNCRNTRPIAERVARIFGDTVDERSAPGPAPRFVESERPGRLGLLVNQLVESLIADEGIDATQLVVLTDSFEVIADLRKRTVEGHLYTSLEGHGIPVDTIRRFKGLERDVVILALTDRACDQDLPALAYVGMSRAKAALFVVGSQKLRDCLKWGQ